MSIKAPKAGLQFQRGEAHSWTDAEGNSQWHSIQTLCEVTEVTPTSARFVVVKVLEEAGRPPHEGAIIHTPGVSGGTYAPFGWAAAIKRGSVVPLAADHLVGAR